MDTSQIILYGVLLVLVVLYVRRRLFLRSLKSYSPAQSAERVRSNNAIFLDVRTGEERQRGSIKGSSHIPLHEIRRRATELEKFKGREIICYCATGSRSLSAAATLTKLGFNAANMKGGMAEWNFSGLK